MASIQETVKWIPPVNGKVKMNWDATVNVSKKKMGIGIVIRDDMGEVLACLSSSRGFISQPIIAECWALSRAMEFCSKLGFYQLEIEGDAQVSIQVIKKEEECLDLVWDID